MVSSFLGCCCAPAARGAPSSSSGLLNSRCVRAARPAAQVISVPPAACRTAAACCHYLCHCHLLPPAACHRKFLAGAAAGAFLPWVFCVSLSFSILSPFYLYRAFISTTCWWATVLKWETHLSIFSSIEGFSILFSILWACLPAVPCRAVPACGRRRKEGLPRGLPQATSNRRLHGCICCFILHLIMTISFCCTGETGHTAACIFYFSTIRLPAVLPIIFVPCDYSRLVYLNWAYLPACYLLLHRAFLFVQIFCLPACCWLAACLQAPGSASSLLSSAIPRLGGSRTLHLPGAVFSACCCRTGAGELEHTCKSSSLFSELLLSLSLSGMNFFLLHLISSLHLFVSRCGWGNIAL